MIVSFQDKATQDVYDGFHVKSLPATILKPAYRKLWMLDAATSLEYMRVPPANHLEKLQGSRAGQHSIRINDQWRICFVWKDGNAHNVEIVDYH
jgi:proteic killer suppression protein